MASYSTEASSRHVSRTPRSDYLAAVEQAKEEIRAGEAFQIVVTGRATQVSVEATSLTSGEGEIADVKLYRADLIDLWSA